MNLNKEININKKFIVLFLLVNIVALCFYYSYALFQVNVIKNNAIVINTSSSIPSITTTIDDTSLNTFTLSANSSKTVSVKITASTTSAMAYKMYYDVEGYGTFRVTSTESFPNNLVEGTFTNTKTISLTFTNSSSSDLTIILGTVGGFESTGATLNGQTELILNQDIIIKEPPIQIKSNNTSSTCQNAKLTYKEDGIIYLSGSRDCIDFNYLWYSGKMWRITAIYPDGRMKMVTEDTITSIIWGSNAEYDGSYIYQWLNEDFYDTLINKDTIIENAIWNYSTSVSVPPVRPETIETQKTKQARVGLLNAYEYYNSYRCNGSNACNTSNYATGYLNMRDYWWLMTPTSDSNVRYVSTNGELINYNASWSYTIGVRPSIILQSGVVLSGCGIKTDPYKLVGSDYESGTIGTELYKRYSGEYVNFDGDLYRIVSTENNITKLTRNDILRDETSTSTPKTEITKNFASSTYFGKNDNTTGDTYWDSYLNNTWYNNISSTYKNMMVDGTYYLGLYRTSNFSYKATICKDSNLNSVTTKNCTKYPTDPNADGYDANKIYIGKVGLPRVGEMFSAQLDGFYNPPSAMWLITPFSSWYVLSVSANATISTSELNSSRPVRPSINLKSTVKILSGSGTELDPYVVGL